MGRPIFEVDFRNRSFIDKVSKTIPTINSVVLKRLSKGYSAYFSSTADLDGYGTVTSVKTIVLAVKPTGDTKILQDNGTDRLEITGGNIGGIGLTECTVNNVDTDSISNDVWSLVIAEFSGGIDFSTDLEIDVTASIDILNVVCYDGILTGLEKTDWQIWFNKSRVVSSPVVLRPGWGVALSDYP